MEVAMPYRLSLTDLSAVLIAEIIRSSQSHHPQKSFPGNVTEAVVPRGHPVPIPWYPTPTPWMLAHPIPTPWMPAVGALVAAVNAQQLAATVEGPLRAQLEQSASASIAQVLDDYCGTPPRLIPWPYPGPPPWVFAIASELNTIANASESPAMQAGLLKVAGQVLERGFGQAPSAIR
jgi:hypothetical protein